MNKKGNVVLDGITILIVVIVFALAAIFGSQVFDEVNTDIQDSDMTATAKSASGDLEGKYVNLFDNIFLFVFILFIIFVLVSVFLLDTHPIFFVVSLILLIFVFILAGLLGNVYNDVVTDVDVVTYSNQFTYMGWVMRHILELIIGIGFLISIALFAKFKT